MTSPPGIYNGYDYMADNKYPGMLVSYNFKEVITKTLTSGSVVCVGEAVVRHHDAAKAQDEVLPFGTSGSTPTNFLGIVLRYNLNKPDEIKGPKGIDILRQGRVYLKAAGEVTAGDGVMIRNSDGGFYRFVENPSEPHTRLKGATWEETGPTGKVLVVRLKDYTAVAVPTT